MTSSGRLPLGDLRPGRSGVVCATVGSGVITMRLGTFRLRARDLTAGRAGRSGLATALVTALAMALLVTGCAGPAEDADAPGAGGGALATAPSPPPDPPEPGTPAAPPEPATPPAPEPEPGAALLDAGDRGPAVRALQDRLVELGFCLVPAGRRGARLGAGAGVQHPLGPAVHGHQQQLAVQVHFDHPALPASHGCVRVTNPAMDWLWSTGRLPIGQPVRVY